MKAANRLDSWWAGAALPQRLGLVERRPRLPRRRQPGRCGLRCGPRPADPGVPGAAIVAGAYRDAKPTSAGPRELHDPVRLPRLAGVGRERLLAARSRRRDVRPDEADGDRLAVEDVGPSKTPPPLAKAPNTGGRGHLGGGCPPSRSTTASPWDRRSEKTFRENHRRSRCGTRPRSQAVRKRPGDARRLELHPVGGSHEPLAQVAIVDVPAAHPEVEVPRTAHLCLLRLESTRD